MFYEFHDFGLVPRFKGYKQQDAHELLSYLLDIIHTEELKRLKKTRKGTVSSGFLTFHPLNDDKSITPYNCHRYYFWWHVKKYNYLQPLFSCKQIFFKVFFKQLDFRT